MKKLVERIVMLLFLLTMSINAAWADETPSGQAMYLASFKAQSSSESTGSGKVKLTWVDVCGRLFVNEIVSFINDPSTMPYGTGNPSNSDVFSSEAMVMGTTMTATESVEENDPEDSGTKLLRLILRNNFDLDTTNIYITPFAYYKADAQGDNGSYFAGWTFNDARVWQQDTAMDKSAPESAYFKVLPNPENVWYLDPSAGLTNLNEAYAGALGAPNNIYAVFNKYLLGNPVAMNANVEAVGNQQANLSVTVEINGDAASLDIADFGTFTFTNNGSSEWAYDLAAALAAKEVVSDQKTRITIPVTYTYKNTGLGLKNTTMAILMAGENPSTLNVNLSVNALDPERPAAFLLEGKDDASPVSGTLAEILGTDISGYTNPIIKLNKNVDDDLTFAGKNFTLDFNGNETQAITVSSGNVTFAYSKFGGEATSLAVNGGKAILNGGTFGSLTIGANGTVEQNGATITGAATNAGSLTTTEGAFNGGLTSSKTLVLNGGTFKGATAITVSGGTAAINRGAIEGTNCGLKVTDGTATVKKLAAIKGGTYSAQRTGGTLIVESGKFDGPLNGDIAFTAGFFKTNTYGVSTEGKKEMNVSVGVEYDEGYRYFLGDAESALENGVGVCRIGTTSYARLEDALAYANNNPNEELVIFMTNNYTLPAGYYTLPSKASIVVPMSDTQSKEINYTAPRLVYNDINNASSNSYENNPLTEFRRLTFANGVKMDVFGDIELTGTQYSTNDAYTSQPVGPYGRLVMEEGSHMTLQSGSELRAWGFMTGKGETDARRGATVREMFQMGDWKGAMTSVAITGMVAGTELENIVANTIVGSDKGDYSDKKIFPVTQYFIQNVESPVKYHPGAKLSTSAAVSEGISKVKMSISMAATDITVVGVSGQHTAIFLMDEMADAENTWVRKWYDAEHDIQVYDINSGAHIGSMELNLGDVSLLGQNIPVRLNSSQFDLPLTNNFKIHLLSGTMDFQQNTCLLPGAEIEVDKESIVTVAMSSEEKAAKDAEIPDYVYHTGALYVYDKADWDKYAFNNKFTKVVRYTPSALNGEGGRPTSRNEDTCPESAKIFVHGTFNTMDGYVYTSAGGAEIYSSNEDAGTFIFGQSASEAGSREVYQIKGKGTQDANYEAKTFTSAKLKNADQSYTETGSAGANQVFMYRDGAWQAPVKDDIVTFYFDCYTAEVDMDVYAEEAGKKLQRIMAQQQYPTMEQLWPTYDLGKAVRRIFIKPQEWLEIAGKAIIEFDYDLEALMAAYTENGQAGLAAYWEICANNPYLAGVDGNADHTYSDADGAGRLFILMPDACQWWEVEKKDNLYHCIHPNNDTYYYWDEDSELWAEKRYTITWKNWDGEIIQTIGASEELEDSYSVTYGTMAEFLGPNPTREATIDYTYDFAGWTPALGPVTNDVTYTATFTQKPRMYTIIFQNEGGVEIERQFLTHNEVPVCENVPTKVGHTLEWSPAIAAVTGDATYRAIWHENPPTEYAITFFDYNGTTKLKPTDETPYMVAVGALPTPPADPAGKPASASGEFTYVFDHWAPALEEVSATSAKSYTAVYREEAVTYTVRFFQEDGETQIGDDQKLAYGAVPAIPTAGIIEPGEAGYTYTYVWENMMDDTKTVEAVKANADYKPRFTGEKIKYTVKLKSNPSEACTFTGAGIYKHGDAITISQTAKPNYTFQNWTDGRTGAVVSELPTTLTGDVDLVANFNYTGEATKYSINWKEEDGTLIKSVTQVEGTATTYTGATPTKEAIAAVTYTFYGWTTRDNDGNILNTYKNGMTPKATANATYYAYFNETARKYTVSWKNEAGTADIEVDYEQPYGAAIEYNSATPTKNADADYSYTFDGWSATQGGAVVSLPATVSGNAAFYAHFSKTPVLPTDLILGAGGSTDLASADVKKNDLVITSNGINSSELKGADNLTLTGEAIFRLEKNFAAQTWYAVAVPWTVALSGIRDKNGNAFAANSLYVLEFDAEVYASANREGGRNDYWHFLHQNGHDMQPGKLYMIWFRSAQTAVQFYKKAGETTIWNTEVSVTTTTGEGAQSNWNAIANPALYHADLSTGATDVLKYNGNDAYIIGSTTNMIVGQPVFVQVETPNYNVTADIAAAPAPYRRAPETVTDANNRFVVELSLAGKLNDRMIVQTAEEKADTYVIGKDLAKMSVSALNAQMWINRYDAKLCKNTLALQGESVEYPLHISAPQTGGYLLSASQERGDATLYLTYNGEAIWNLSESDYVLQLEKGTTANYGLRISARKTPTGIDEAVVDAQGKIEKVLINDKVFIIRGNNVYSVDGQMVK